MPLNTFTPAVNPSLNYSKNVKARTRRADFGDGYSQRVADGLNTIKREVSLNFEALSTSQADDIETFLIARAGAEAFLYTLPDEVSARKWICPEWSRGPQAGTLRSITATFEEVFDIT